VGLEVATYINGLVTTNPVGASDPKSQGDDHLRLIKTVLKNTFPNLTGAMTLTQAQLNAAAQTNAANVFTTRQTIDTGDTDFFNGRLLDLKSFAPSMFFWDETTSSQKCLVSVDGNILKFHSTPNTDGTAMTERMSIDLATGDIDFPGDVNIDGALTASGTTFGFESGTRCVFQQTAAPTGWTKDTTHNNKALRLVTGSVSSGGSVAFSTAFASKAVTGSIGNTTDTGTIQNTTATGTVGNTTLTASQIPAHTHSFSGSDSATTSSAGSHTHSRNYRDGAIGGGTVNIVVAESSSDGESATGMNADGAHTHSVSVTISGTTGSAGSGGSHNHAFTGVAHNHTLAMNAHNHTFTGTAINLAVQYVDFIIAEKD
jgi:hypothetical protein